MKRTFSILAVLLVIMLAAAAAAPAAAQGASRSYLLVAQNKLPNNLESQVAAIGGTVERVIPQIGVAVVSSSNPDFKAQAAGIRGIQSALPNVRLQWIDPPRREAVTADQFGNPPASGDDDFFFDLQWGHDAVDAPEAWAAGARGAGVRVAVLDDGIDSDHPDIAPNFNAGLSTSFVPGQTYEYAVPGDVFSHGTHVSGTILAADNGFGTIGVAPEAELVMVKVLDSFTGSGSFEGVAAGIVYAADVDADIINMSLGATVWRSGYVDEDTGELLPVLTIVTDNGGPFRSLNFELFIMRHPELRHVRTRVKSPGQNGSRERGFGTLKYERLFLDEIPDALTLIERAEDYRIEYNTVRPHEAIAWNRPIEVHLGIADPTIPNFEIEETLPTT